MSAGTSTSTTAPYQGSGRRRRPSFTRLVTIGVLGFFLVMLAGVVGSVLISSIATRWLNTWLPEGYTLSWFSSAWQEFGLTQVLIVTLQVAISVLVVTLIIAIPAAYVLARQDFPGKRLLTVLFLLPVVVPTITYGVPLATLLYRLQLAQTLPGIILINLVPSVPFAILILMPFVEQVDESLEKAARIFGARNWQVFARVVLPLLAPGIVATSILLLVRTIAMFDLTFLVAGPTTQTLVVKLFYAVSAAGFRSPQSIDAMAVIYMATNVLLLAVAFKFINPARIVGGGAH